jgi:cysteine synthase
MHKRPHTIQTIDHNILETIGKTPLLRLNKIIAHINTPVPLVSESVHIYAKLERYNPGGSVKDRAA